ncbi:DUF5060 domain-containing protein [Reinekea marinisedimentorum]|uniref:Collagenase-like protein with putative collagen-binding domain n=1 Tax=Reinekea marinisedimentorum TaxID=230495 RepID=A0A4R3HY05_9GAMM|nr:DUF5060 domain-containing protein [Reinekea marinisedimentorum]TCS37095.1 collagenase-like protein with putative collagen-binding domain [Reinekea marinisedimentorum]
MFLTKKIWLTIGLAAGLFLVGCDSSSLGSSESLSDGDVADQVDNGTEDSTDENTADNDSEDDSSADGDDGDIEDAVDYLEGEDVTYDECNTTAQCQTLWGSTAYDCVNSQSDTSYCMCADGLCSDVFADDDDDSSTDDDNDEASEDPGSDTETAGTCTVTGTLEQWHRVELLCQGFQASEADDATFTDYRFNVTFSQNDLTYAVPGHFAADGAAAYTGAATGDTWRAYFAPPTTGEWQYSVSFRTGSSIAVSEEPGDGVAVDELDGLSGMFSVADASASATDLRNHGLLRHVAGEHYLRFAGDGSIYIEGGMDSPENIFGYDEFDNTYKYDNASSCKGILHSFAEHEDDWQDGDPSWGDDERGKSLIGLINYIAGHKVNAMYVMANTVNGDGCDAHPWTEYNENSDVKTFDISKLDQWEIAFDHMTENGIMIHLVTQETENDQDLNGGDLGLERKLYYRELISRFAHHPAIQWNLGEENTNTTAQRQAFAEFFKSFDPYGHQITLHTYPSQQSEYEGMLGDSNFDGLTIQYSAIPETDGLNSSYGEGVYGDVVYWHEASEAAGHRWIVSFTEASGSNAPTPYDEVSDRQRIYWMWASVMSGGAGFEWYLKNDGSGHAYDLAVEDLREFDSYWAQSGYLVSFFADTLQGQFGMDLQDLSRDNDATDTGTDWVLSDAGNAYVIYLREGGATNITLPNDDTYQLHWMNPRTGEYSQTTSISGAGNVSLSYPADYSDEDWVVLVVAESFLNATADEATATTYAGADGLVIIEAENTLTEDLGEWFEDTAVSGYTGDGYLEFDGNSAISGNPNSPLEYTFTVDQSGLYYLHMRASKEILEINGETRTDVANDAYVRLEGNFDAGDNVCDQHGCDADLDTLMTDTKMYGGSNLSFSWMYGNRLDLGGDTNKRVAVYRLYAGEPYTFVLSGRSRYFKVDRIMFRHEDLSASSGDYISLAETK